MYAEEPNIFIALGLIAVVLVINAPLLILVRRWYRGDEAGMPAVRLPVVYPAIMIGCALLLFLVSLFMTYGYLTEVSGIGVGILIAFGPASITACSLLTLILARFRILVFDDCIKLRPTMGKEDFLFYKDVEEAFVTELGNLKILFGGDKPTSLELFANAPNCDALLDKLKCSGVEIGRKLQQERSF